MEGAEASDDKKPQTVIPPPPGAKERGKWLSVFPEEIWIMIVKHVREPNDQFNCAKASTYLERLLQPKRTFYMFPQVLKSLFERSFLDSPNPANRPEISRNVLRLRLVCRAWNEGVLDFLQIRPYHFKCRDARREGTLLPPEARRDPAFYTFFRMYSYGYRELTDIVLPQIMHPAREYQGNQNTISPSRHLHINEFRRAFVNSFQFLDKYASGPIYRFTVEQVLAQVGHHFWHLTVDLRDSLTFIDGHDLLRRLLVHLPNLKSLYVAWDVNHNPLVRFEDEGPLALPFPPLPNLQLVSLQNMPAFTITAVMGVSPNVTTVEIVTPCEDLLLVPVAVTFRGISSLTSLCVQIVTVEDLAGMSPNWKLEYLRLSIKSKLPLGPIFDKILEYADTLTELHIVMALKDSPKEEHRTWQVTSRPWKLPKLQKATFFIFDGVFSLQFLGGLTSLEYLFLCVFYDVQSLGGGGPNVKELCQHHFCKRTFAYLAKYPAAKAGALGAERAGRCRFSSPTISDIWRLRPNLKELYYRHNFDPATIVNYRNVPSYYNRMLSQCLE